MPLTLEQARRGGDSLGKPPRKNLVARPRLETDVDFSCTLFQIKTADIIQECKFDFGSTEHLFAYMKENEIRFYHREDFWTHIVTFKKGDDKWEEIKLLVEEHGLKCHPSVTFE